MKEQLISEFVVEACKAASDPKTAYDLSMVCEISDQLLHVLHPEIESHDALPTPPNLVMSEYTELSQSLFNGYLSDVERALEDIGLTYELDSCTWVVAPKEET